MVFLRAIIVAGVGRAPLQDSRNGATGTLDRPAGQQTHPPVDDAIGADVRTPIASTEIRRIVADAHPHRSARCRPAAAT